MKVYIVYRESDGQNIAVFASRESAVKLCAQLDKEESVSNEQDHFIDERDLLN